MAHFSTSLEIFLKLKGEKMIISERNGYPVSMGDIVRHFKGNLYLILTLCEHTESRERLIVYKSLYGQGDVWCRPLKMFLEEVPKGKVNSTNQRYRFEKFEPESKSRYEEGD